jgi:hypothetical protein
MGPLGHGQGARTTGQSSDCVSAGEGAFSPRNVSTREETRRPLAAANASSPPTAVDPARRLNVCFGVAATIG